MTTASTNTVIDHTSDAGYRAWADEIITQLLAVGLTQTSDTGQINTSTVTRPGTNTVNAYAIFRFNDTLHATNPIFIRLDFGTGGSTSTPALRMQVGRGSNGSGTLTGLTTNSYSCFMNTAPSSTVTPYISRFCYNATQGFLGMTFKWGFNSSSIGCIGSLFVFRSTDSSGDPTADSTMVLTNSSSTNGTTSSGYCQVISHIANLAYTTNPFPSPMWQPPNIPFSLTGTLYGGNAQVLPCWQYTPVLGVTNQLALCLNTEIGIHSTVTLAPVSSTTRTYINIGLEFSNSSRASGLSTSWGLLMLWE